MRATMMHPSVDTGHRDHHGHHFGSDHVSSTSKLAYDDDGGSKRKSVQLMDKVDLLAVTEDTGPVRFVDTFSFNACVMSAIVVNALQMGLELQLTATPWEYIWFGLEQFFTLFFLVELLIKLSPAMGPTEYFSSKANWLDFVVSIVAVLDNWILSLILSEGGDIGFVAILRLVRLGRILKLLKAKRELQMLIEGILGSIKSMFWLGILLGILIYVSAIAFSKFIGKSDDYADTDFDAEFYFGDLFSASVSCLNLALLQDFPVVFRGVIETQPIFGLCIGVYVAVSCFGIMNAIIGVIVTRTSQAADAAAADDLDTYRQQQMTFIDSVRDIIYEIDTDGDGTVSPQEIQQASDNELLIEALSRIDLPSGFSMLELHCMLDKDGDGELTKFEFTQGMKRMVFSNEFQRECLLMLTSAQTKRKLNEMKENLTDAIITLNHKIDALPTKFQTMLDNHVPKRVDGDQILPIPEQQDLAGGSFTSNSMNVENIPGCLNAEKMMKVTPKRAAALLASGKDFSSAAPTAQATAQALQEVSNVFAEAAQMMPWAADDDMGLPSPPNMPSHETAVPPAGENPYAGLRSAARPAVPTGPLYPGIVSQHVVHDRNGHPVPPPDTGNRPGGKAQSHLPGRLPPGESEESSTRRGRGRADPIISSSVM